MRPTIALAMRLQIVQNSPISRDEMVSPVRVGDVVAEKYSVERIVAAGGSGVIVEAKHLVLRERCAIKFLLPATLDLPLARERFVREAQALARLKSDHIVRIFDVADLPDGTPYMVMEFLDGSDLDAIVASRGALPVAEASLYVLQVCAALADAHALGIVHRDLKPANVMLTIAADGMPRAKLVDFGVSKVMRDARGLEPMKTADGTLIGTPLYMAPEQVYGGEVGIAADVWAVGVLLYQLVTGALPFQEDATVMSLAHILSRPPKPIASHGVTVPAEIEEIILACLQKSADKRPASVAEIADRLAPFADEGQPISLHVRRVLDSSPEARSSLVGLSSVSKSAATLAAPMRDSTSPAATTANSEIAKAPPRPRWIAPALLAAVIVIALGVTVIFTTRAKPLPPVAASVAAIAPTHPATVGDTAADLGATAKPEITAASESSATAARASASAPVVSPREEASSKSRASTPAPPPKKASNPATGFDLDKRH